MSELIEMLNIKGVSRVTPISDGFQNKVYDADWNGRKVILRLSEQSRRSLEQLHAEIDWLEYLASNGLSVAKAIHPVIMNAFVMGVPHYAVIFKHTKGRPVNVLDRSEWNEDLFERLGEMIASLHNSGASELSRPIWLEENDLSQKVKDTPWLQKAYENSIREMERFNRNEHYYGLIHNDLHTGNFHMSGQDLILFDFDDCAYHFYAQDLAVIIYHALWTGTSYQPEWTELPERFLTSLLKGYMSERLLLPDLFDQLCECLKMREIFLFALFQEKWDTNDLEDWQANKLIELEESIRNGKIPFERDLIACKNYFVQSRNK